MLATFQEDGNVRFAERALTQSPTAQDFWCQALSNTSQLSWVLSHQLELFSISIHLFSKLT